VVIVDTSVWIAARRSPDGAHATALRSLLDADEVALALPVRIEFVAAAAKKDRLHLRKALAALPLVVPTDETWHQVEKWVSQARDAGYGFALSDLIIASLAHELTALVWSLDNAFERMEKLGFVQRY
jgi:predicted nucleic acid-binding protein